MVFACCFLGEQQHSHPELAWHHSKQTTDVGADRSLIESSAGSESEPAADFSTCQQHEAPDTSSGHGGAGGRASSITWRALLGPRCLRQQHLSSTAAHKQQSSALPAKEADSAGSSAPPATVSCMSLLHKALKKAPGAAAAAGGDSADSSRPGHTKPAGAVITPRGQMSLQGSGSLIPADFMLRQQSLNNTDTDSNAAQESAGAGSGGGGSGSDTACATDKLHHQAGHNSSSSQRVVEGGSLLQNGPGGSLTLVVSSHSHSTHHDGSPSALHSASSSRASSRASCDSAHTAFASIPSSVCASGSLTPDSMMSALSTTSSCISNHSSSSADYYRSRALAAAAASGGGGSSKQPAGGVQQGGSGGGSTQLLQLQQQQQHASQVQELLAKVVREQQQCVTPAGSSAGAEQSQQHQGSAATAAAESDGLLTSPFAAAAAAGAPLLPGSPATPRQQSSGWSYACHSDQNLRSHMEDRSVCLDFTGHATFPAAYRAGLFSVFDGHGGHQVAEFLAEHVQAALLAAEPDAIARQPLQVLGDAVDAAERQLLLGYAGGDSTAAAGSTLCAVLLIDDKLHVAHVGDSRAVLARGSAAKQLTRDHKPACEIEARRIMSDDPDAQITSDGYLYAELAVSRAIGSAHLKRDPSKKALIATAEVATFQLEEGDDFVLIASDGLWDKISSSEAVSVARRVLCDTKDAGTACRALVERAQRMQSGDNISVITLLLHSRAICMPKSNSMLRRRAASPSPPSS